MLRPVGIFRLIFFVSLVAAFLLFKLPDLNSANGFFVVILYPLMILPVHLLRKDQDFIKKLDQPKEVIFMAEYHALVVPFSLCLLFFHQWPAVLSGHLLISLIPFIPSLRIKKKKSGIDFFTYWIPAHLFEWRSFGRQHAVYIIIGFSLILLLSSNAVTMALAILIMVASLSEAYSYLEPKELMEIYPANRAFLRAKLKDHSLFIHLVFLPFYLLFLMLHSDFWYLPVLLIIVIECSICFCLLYKYSWFGRTNSKIRNQIPFFVYFLTTLLFFPIGIALLYFYWKKAVNTLPDYA